MKSEARITPTAQQGVLDLTQWNFKKDGPVALNGQWEFYWQADLRPDQTPIQRLPGEKSYISVPGIWNGSLSPAGAAPGTGFATYRLKILAGRHERRLGLRFIDVATAFSAYVNGRKVVSVGRPGRNAEESVPEFKPQVVDFSPRSGEIDLLIFVSNFHHGKGGLWEVIQLGDPADLRDRREGRIIFGWFLLGAILLMGLYHLGLSLSRKRERPSFFFGTFCLIICARLLTTGERSLMQVFPEFPWEALVKISYLSFYAAVPVFSLYVKSLFPEELPRKILWVVGLVGGIFSAVVLFTPALFYTRTVQIYQTFCILMYFVGVYVIAAAVRRKRQGALAFFIGYWILILTGINDILYSNLFIVSSYLFPFGLFAFILLQAFMLSNRFGKAFSTIELREGELLQSNTRYRNELEERARVQAVLSRSREELQARVQERTIELAAANSYLQREIAERRQAEELLRHSQKLQAIGTLAGGIAHDFNNILQVISINADLALMDVPPDSGAAGKLELIAGAGERGRDLVRQVLLFSRKAEPRHEVFSLMPLIEETSKLLRSSIPTTIEMALVLEAESDVVEADPSQIQQVIMNLCTNAAYAMRRDTGRLEIFLGSAVLSPDSLPDPEIAPGEYLLISVRDTGYGMDDEIQKRVFEPFFTTKPPGEGTGLGLSVVYGIVKSHRGAITVASEPGKGSVFNVYLPKSKSAEPVRPGAAEPPPRGKERILFVDDESLVVDSVVSMMERLGYRVTGVTDSSEALTIFSNDPFRFDLVMTDFTMPVMTGEDLGKRIMSIRPDIPVILCTGFHDVISPEIARAEGFREFVMKPFSVREGAKLIRRVLDQDLPHRE